MIYDIPCLVAPSIIFEQTLNMNKMSIHSPATIPVKHTTNRRIKI